MENKPSRWQIFKIKLGMGVPFAPVVNLGQIDHSTVIRFKDYYVNLMESDGEIVNFSWSKDPHMFPDVNINDFWSSAEPARGAITQPGRERNRANRVGKALVKKPTKKELL